MHRVNAIYSRHAISNSENNLCKQIENRRTDVTGKLREGRHLNSSAPEKWHRNRAVDSKH